MAEWSESAKILGHRTLAIARGYGCSKEFERYLQASGGFWKFIYPLAGSIQDRDLRQQIGIAFALHCYGIKLLDDIIDKDQPFPPEQLLVGHQFCDQANVDIANLGFSKVFFGEYRRFWPVIWPHLRREPTVNLATVEDWKESALIKCGMILDFYASVGVLIADGRPFLRSISSAMRAMGVIYTLLDDIRDVDNPLEAHSNIWNLLRQGGCTIEEIHNLLAEQKHIFESNIINVPLTFPAYFPCQDAIYYCENAIRIYNINSKHVTVT